MKRPTNAFTLVELLAVITIIAILAGLVLTVLSSMQNSVQATKCSSNLRQAYLAFCEYLADNENTMPQRFYKTGDHDTGVKYYDLLSRYTGNPSPDKRTNIFVCPSHHENNFPNQPSYGMNWYYDNANILSLPSPSYIIMLAETAGPDGKGSNRADKGSDTPGELAPTRHGGFSNYLFFDGHVEKLKYPQTVLRWGTDMGDHDQPPPAG